MKTLTNQIVPVVKFFGLIFTIATLLAFLQSCTDPAEEIAPTNNNSDPEPKIDTVDNEVTPVSIDFDYLTVNDSAEIKDSTIYYHNNAVSGLSIHLFQAANSSDDTRPVVLLAPGGAYSKYTQSNEIKALCKNLAKRGYVVGFLEYSLGPQGGEVFVESNHDQVVGIRYFKKNAAALGIDAASIFIGGWSTGAHIALYSAYMSQSDYENIDQDIIHQMVDAELDSQGFLPDAYGDFDHQVKGTILMMPFVWDLNIFQADEPAAMIIVNEQSQFADGTSIMGEVSINGIKHYGPDKINERFLELGYTEGENYEYILTDPELNSQWSHVNYTPMDQMYYDDVASFLKNNLD